MQIEAKHKRVGRAKKTPVLRYPGFDEDWEELSYGKVFKFIGTNSLSREDLNYEKGIVKNIHYGDIHTKFQTNFDISKENVPFINPKINVSKIKEEDYCREGDLVLADASEDFIDVGKTIEIRKLHNQKLVAGLHTYIARPKDKIFIIGFPGYLMQSWTVRLQIMILAQGTKVHGISARHLSAVLFKIPSLPEQQKIASFLSAVDDRIRQLTRKKELLEQYKKGVMQKIFKQEVRFNDKDGKDYPDWEIIRAKNIFRNHSNKNHNGDLPILAASQEKGMVLRDSIEIRITSSEASVKSYKIVEKGDFVISLRSFQGGIEYSNIKVICSPAYTILKPRIPIYDQFFKYYFKKEDFIERLSKTIIGIRDGKQITYENFGGLKLKVPSIEEQKKIANFLASIDKKTEQVSLQLEKARAFKKGLLQQMFV